MSFSLGMYYTMGKFSNSLHRGMVVCFLLAIRSNLIKGYRLSQDEYILLHTSPYVPALFIVAYI